MSYWGDGNDKRDPVSIGGCTEARAWISSMAGAVTLLYRFCYAAALATNFTLDFLGNSPPNARM
jgi:hypothetical protein